MSNVEQTTETTVALSNSASLETLAQTLANKIDANADAIGILEETLKAQETAKRGPISIAFYVFMPIFGDDLDVLPAIWRGDENSPHLMKVSRKTKTGTDRLINTDFYAIMADDTEAGRTDMFIIEQCSLALNGDTKANAEEAYRQMDRNVLLSTKDSANNRRTNRRRLFRTAAEIIQKMIAIEEKLGEKVNVDFVTDEGPNDTRILVKASNALYIQDKKSPMKMDQYSAGSFLKLDIDKALANGGGYQALVDSVKREGQSGQGGASTTAGNDIPNSGKFVEAMYAMSRYLGADDPNAKNISGVVKEISKDQEALLAFGDYAKIIGDIYQEVESDYINLNNAKSAVARKELANKARATA